MTWSYNSKMKRKNVSTKLIDPKSANCNRQSSLNTEPTEWNNAVQQTFLLKAAQSGDFCYFHPKNLHMWTARVKVLRNFNNLVCSNFLAFIWAYLGNNC